VRLLKKIQDGIVLSVLEKRFIYRLKFIFRKRPWVAEQHSSFSKRVVSNVQKAQESREPVKSARIAVARKLRLIAFAIFKSGELFRENNVNSNESLDS